MYPGKRRILMNYYDEQLKQLQSQMAEKMHLEKRLEDLHSQYEESSPERWWAWPRAS